MYDPNISIFRDLFKSTDVPYVIPLSKAIQRIKSGKSKTQIELIRNAKSKEERDRLKKKLPCILFAGEFSQRNSDSLVKHSGLMVVDFDNYPDKQTMESHFAELKKIPYFICLFVSPSDIGIKGVVRVPDSLNKQTHSACFKAFRDTFKLDYFDISNSNVDRVCYESYDPDIYVNEKAKVFNPTIKDEGFSISEKVPIVKVNDSYEIIEKIMAWNWKADFTEGQRNSYVFNLSGAFCEYGIPLELAEGYILNNVVIGDFPESEAVNAIRSAYKSRSYGIKYFENYPKINRIKSDMKMGKKKVMEVHNIDEKTFDQICESNETQDFWFFDDKGKVRIIPFDYKHFLQTHGGFKKYFPNDSQKPVWVQIKSNRVTETSVEKIKDHVLDYLLERNEIDVWNHCVNFSNMFSEQYLLMLDSIDLMMLNDKKDTSYIAYQNCILEIAKDKISEIDYIDVDGYVWESQIIKRDFIKSKDYTNEYQQFIKNISGESSKAMEASIGYLLSTYKNKMNNKAIILNDEVISDNPEGGTGKGLFVQGLRQIRNVSILDGKTFDDKKSFPYQTVSPETQILVFDDVKKNFDFESKFSIVTEGMTLERKNKDAIKLSVEQSPKMLISTNYAIKGEGNSHDRRRHELEVSQYYGRDKTPYDEFGHQLFDDWSELEYVRFDNYMVHCIQLYLKEGLIHQNASNIVLRKFIASTCMEFYEWITNPDQFQVNKRYTNEEAYNQFISEYKDFGRWLNRRTFKIWIKKYCNFSGLQYDSGNTQGQRWFMVMDENKTIDDGVPF